jgi:hypothetical protein
LFSNNEAARSRLCAPHRGASRETKSNQEPE